MARCFTFLCEGGGRMVVGFKIGFVALGEGEWEKDKKQLLGSHQVLTDVREDLKRDG